MIIIWMSIADDYPVDNRLLKTGRLMALMLRMFSYFSQSRNISFLWPGNRVCYRTRGLSWQWGFFPSWNLDHVSTNLFGTRKMLLLLFVKSFLCSFMDRAMRQREEKSINILEGKSSACTNHGNVTIKLNSCCTSNLSHLRRPRGGQSGWKKVGGEVVENFRQRLSPTFSRPDWPPWASEDEFSHASHWFCQGLKQFTTVNIDKHFFLFRLSLGSLEPWMPYLITVAEWSDVVGLRWAVSKLKNAQRKSPLSMLLVF